MSYTKVYIWFYQTFLPIVSTTRSNNNYFGSLTGKRDGYPRDKNTPGDMIFQEDEVDR